MTPLPLLAITMGDPSGIGPEVTVKALADGALHAVGRPLVVGDAGVLGAAAQACRVEVPLHPVRDPAEAMYRPGSIAVLDLANVDRGTWRWGTLSATSGRAAMEYIYRAMELVDSGAQVIVLLALSDDGAPAYDHDHAAALAALGIPAFACTPDLFPDLMAAAIERRDLQSWTAAQGLHTAAPLPE